MTAPIRAGIRTLGGYAPERILSNFDLEKMMDTSDAWITERTGIKTRHVAAAGEFSSSLAIKSVEDLLARHGDEALAGVDLTIVATCTPDAYFPSTASLVQRHFKLAGAAFDLSAACSGWLYALASAKAQVEAGMAKRALVIGAEVLSKVINWQDRTTAVLFGDGAGAAIVEAVPEGYGFKSFVLGGDGSGAHHLTCRAVADVLPDGAPLQEDIYMNGREVFKFAVRVMNTATVQAVEEAGLHSDDINLFVPHQANLRIIEAARERLGLPPERVEVTVDKYGNNSAASIPLALRHAVDEHKLQRGDNVLLIAFGAGLSWASTVLTWGGDA